MKATAGIVNGETRAIFKKPKTDKDNLKPSAKGYIKVVKDKKGDFKLVDNIVSLEASIEDSELKEVFRDGKLLVDQTLKDIRERVAAQS
jgi:nicotinamide phosphoribosyltransferase